MRSAGNPWDPANCPHGHPHYPETCWADSAYQECHIDPQGAYDYVMGANGQKYRYYRYIGQTRRCRAAQGN
jgi:hypothetical protein